MLWVTCLLLRSSFRLAFTVDLSLRPDWWKFLRYFYFWQVPHFCRSSFRVTSSFLIASLASGVSGTENPMGTINHYWPTSVKLHQTILAQWLQMQLIIIWNAGTGGSRSRHRHTTDIAASDLTQTISSCSTASHNSKIVKQYTIIVVCNMINISKPAFQSRETNCFLDFNIQPKKPTPHLKKRKERKKTAFKLSAEFQLK